MEPAGTCRGRLWPKLVFAPPIGAPRCKIHVRLAGSETTRLALRFRDDLRANPDKMALWSGFKLKLADAPELSAHGQIRAPAWLLVLNLAGAWARFRHEE